MANSLLDPVKFVSRYTQTRPDGIRVFTHSTVPPKCGNAKRCGRAMGGSIAVSAKTGVLSESGLWVLSNLVTIAKSKPKFNGLSSQGIYFKWLLTETTTEVDLGVARDWLQDQGYEVEWKNLRGWVGEGSRCGITAHYVSLKIKHPVSWSEMFEEFDFSKYIAPLSMYHYRRRAKYQR